MKNICALLILFVITQFPISCDQTDCDSGPGGTFLIQEMIVEFGSMESDVLTSIIPVFPGDTVDHTTATLIIRVTDAEFISALQQPLSNPFMNSVYACSPVPPSAGHSITSIEITSDQTVFTSNIQLAAGELLNDLFDVAVGTNTPFNHSVASFVTDLNIDADRFGLQASQLALRLKSKPDQVFNQGINIEINFDDGNTFTLNLVNIRID